MDIVHNMDQDPEYPAYPIESNGSIRRWRRDSFDSSCLFFFSPERWTL